MRSYIPTQVAYGISARIGETQHAHILARFVRRQPRQFKRHAGAIA